MWATAIFTLSSLPIKLQEPAYPNEDKVVHILLFGVLALLLLRAFLFKQKNSTLKAALLAFLLTLLYGGFDEWHQGFTPERTVDVWDWAADILGAAFVFPAIALIKRIKLKKP